MTMALQDGLQVGSASRTELGPITRSRTPLETRDQTGRAATGTVTVMSTPAAVGWTKVKGLRRPGRWKAGSAVAVAFALGGCDIGDDFDDLFAGECTSCEIVLEEAWASVARDPAVQDVGTWIEWGDSIWTMQGFAGHQIIIYSASDGGTRTIDRFGEGPGEFRSIRAGALDISSDSLFVAETARVSVLTGGGEFARSFVPEVPFTRGRSFGVTSDGHILLPVPRRSDNPDAIIHRLHLLTREGVLLHSFAPGDPDRRMTLGPSASPSTFWLMEDAEGGFRVELWNVESREMVRAFDVRPDWWSSGASSGESEQEIRQSGTPPTPPSIAISIREEAGVLFVAAVHPTPDPVPFDEETYDPTGEFDSVVLAVDAESGVILAAQLIEDRFISGWSREGLLPTWETDRMGFPRYRLHTVQLERD